MKILSQKNKPTTKDATQFISGRDSSLTYKKIGNSRDTMLKQVPGMTNAHHRDFPRSEVFITCHSGVSVRTWRNPVNVLHVFVADKFGELIFGGFVGWIHTDGLLACLRDIRRHFKQ